jgi:ubiquitin C-terminal hydrolase
MMNYLFQIALAKSVDSDAYVEPIQRLADLEWLSHKDKNRSAIDDLFTGQLVEAQHCLSCYRISVGIQTFNILPVPIVEPRELTGLVYLEDCFAKFGHTEDLSGPDGLRCENCSNVDLGASPVFTNGGRTNAVLRRPPPRRLVQPPTDSPIPSHAAMSPIPGGAGEMFNDSGYLPNTKSIRTSTPINSGGPMSMKTTDGQKRSLLRQLPECLVVQLMRFTMRQGDGGPSKIAAPVTIPLTQLDLTRLVIDNVMVHNQRPDAMQPGTSFRYSLYALCLHLGANSTATGHYVSYVRAAADNTWYRYDDARVTPVNMEYELNTRQVRENAYLLFYKKVM